ncbi:MAG TPA: PfkB family carbohydrate kinase [Chthoniobacteraceae bacterium]|nr:PfkB family carbohydrate kinase [Chthoniobacteraceae bacterium]
MSRKNSLPLQVAKQIQAAGHPLATTNVLVGLDGFVDTIMHVVARRESATKFTRMAKISDFAARVADAAGQSANFEMVTQMVKLGGNGPIMANALGSYGTKVTYIGNLGAPNVHSVFKQFAKDSDLYSIAEPGYTDAIEFEDGKLMCGKHESLKEITWETILKYLPKEKLIRKFNDASLIALVNWTMLPHMNGIFNKILKEVGPALTNGKRWVFFDLADPAKRTREDIADVLKIIARFQKYFRVILGLNFSEGRQIGEVLGIKAPVESHEAVTTHAAHIQDKLKVETVVIHPTQFAAAADANGATYVVGPYTPKPKITTGAGDHFNAGFCIGRLLDGDLATSLQIGVATSGYYVRNAKSPSLADLKKFLGTL